jgi:NCS1 family nucleobase:cation symporter-1
VLKGILCSDFFLVKRRCLDVPALYDPKGRYSYSYGTNWVAIVALAAALGPTLPGLIHAVNPDIDISGAEYVADFNWYYGIVTSSVVYTALSLIFPAEETLVPYMVTGVIEGMDAGEMVTLEKSAKEKELAIVTTTRDDWNS